MPLQPVIEKPVEAGATAVFEFVDRFRRAVQSRRRAVALSAYAGVSGAAFMLAWMLEFGTTWPAGATRVLVIVLPILLAIRIATDLVFKLSIGRWRFVSTRDVLRLAGATTVGMIVFWAVTRGLGYGDAVPLSVILMEWVLTGYMTAVIWIGYRTLFEQVRHYKAGINGRARRVLIVGAGDAGNLLAREMRRFPTGYKAVGFVDDDPYKRGTRVYGLEVLGSTAELSQLVVAHAVEEIVIAIPSTKPDALQRIVAACELTGLHFRVLPGYSATLAGNVQLTQLREVRIEDLLGRPPVQLDLSQLDSDLRNRTVLVTGAAGSIGSELARQVALHSPGRLVLLDQAETELFFLNLELKDSHPDLAISAIVGDIVDAEGIEQLFRRFNPSHVFHAAAYKHVPVMEDNAREAVRNNVIGTMRVADAAGRHGAAKFVLVSTDKAAQPANVMGTTKRLAEMLVLELQQRYAPTMFTAVRFGNVLGSNGSVIPIFEKQLRAGKPLTVTHPEATRYFMTITEAVQLILQSSLLPELAGNIAVLEMGEPVRIVELAENMLRLSGVPHRNGDSIVFTGLRPGEKLHEELVAPDEESLPTAVPKVSLIRSVETPMLLPLGQLSDGTLGFAPENGGVLAWLEGIFPSLKNETQKQEKEKQQEASIAAAIGIVLG